MRPCTECRFAVETKAKCWPVACHRRAPTTPLADDEVGCWPLVSPDLAACGCGEFEGAAQYETEMQQLQNENSQLAAALACQEKGPDAS